MALQICLCLSQLALFGHASVIEATPKQPPKVLAGSFSIRITLESLWLDCEKICAQEMREQMHNEDRLNKKLFGRQHCSTSPPADQSEHFVPTWPHLMKAGPALSRVHRMSSTQENHPQPKPTQMGDSIRAGMKSSMRYSPLTPVYISSLRASIQSLNSFTGSLRPRKLWCMLCTRGGWCRLSQLAVMGKTRLANRGSPRTTTFCNKRIL